MPLPCSSAWSITYLLNKSVFVYLDDILIFLTPQFNGETRRTCTRSAEEVTGEQVVCKSREM